MIRNGVRCRPSLDDSFIGATENIAKSFFHFARTVQVGKQEVVVTIWIHSDQNIPAFNIPARLFVSCVIRIFSSIAHFHCIEILSEEFK